ncbi:hypothetical protein OSB04_000952, partial [Centaurea solstitialis]
MKFITATYDELQKAYFVGLQNMTVVALYVHEHMAMLHQMNRSMSTYVCTRISRCKGYNCILCTYAVLVSSTPSGTSLLTFTLLLSSTTSN